VDEESSHFLFFVFYKDFRILFYEINWLDLHQFVQKLLCPLTDQRLALGTRLKAESWL
jgi:hypothetical protein